MVVEVGHAIQPTIVVGFGIALTFIDVGPLVKPRKLTSGGIKVVAQIKLLFNEPPL